MDQLPKHSGQARQSLAVGKGDKKRDGQQSDGAAARAVAPNVGEVIDGQTLRFNAERIIGNGSFGVVFRASVVETGEVVSRAGKESEIPNFKGSDLGRFPLVSADFWTSDHLSERSRSMDAFSGTRARGTLTLKRR